MLKSALLSFTALSLIVVSGSAIAQTKVPVAPSVTPAATTTIATDPDYAKKLELAQQMHKIRPAKAQVQEAVQQVGANLSPIERDKFNKIVEKAFDYDKLEKVSVDTMVSLFTVAELQKMVDYFGSPEAKTIATKLPKYQEKIQPLIIQMMDKAMIEQRTGGEAPPPNIAPATLVPAPVVAPVINPNPAQAKP